jgi:tetratricopeptide (TPR) repeat protein
MRCPDNLNDQTGVVDEGLGPKARDCSSGGRLVVMPTRNLLAFIFVSALVVSAQSTGSSRAKPRSADPQILQQYFEAGQKALSENRYAHAEKAYEELLKLDPGIAEVHANLGLVYFQQRKFEQAIPALRRALKLKPTLAKSSTLLAMSLSELGQYREALPTLEKGFRSTDPPTRRMCGLQLLRAYTGLQRDSQAVEVAMLLNKLYPDDPEILYQTGKIYGNYAFLTIRKLAEVAPASGWRHLAIAEASESKGAHDVAIGEYRAVLERYPNWPGLHYRLGRTLLARSLQTTSDEDTKAALEEFKQELQLDPTHANAAYEIGEIHRTTGQWDDARNYFEIALKYYPDFEDAQLAIANVLMSQQKPELALSHLQMAITLNRDNPVAWYRLAQVQARLGNNPEREKAFAEFQRLKNQETAQQDAGAQVLSSEEVTKQRVETGTDK